MPRTFENKQNTNETKSTPNTNITVHEVHILDGSSSMSGSKFYSAVEGINSDLEASCKASKDFGVKGTYSIIQFSDQCIIERSGNIILKDITTYQHQPIYILGGWTALYDTIDSVVKFFIEKKNKKDKVLLKIFTDGEDNRSRISINKISEIIKKIQKEDNFTVTFVGTELDVNNIVRDLSIDKSNTLTHDNTSVGITAAFMATRDASIKYRKSVAEGKEVTRGFYAKSTD